MDIINKDIAGPKGPLFFGSISELTGDTTGTFVNFKIPRNFPVLQFLSSSGSAKRRKQEKRENKYSRSQFLDEQSLSRYVERRWRFDYHLSQGFLFSGQSLRAMPNLISNSFRRFASQPKSSSRPKTTSFYDHGSIQAFCYRKLVFVKKNESGEYLNVFQERSSAEGPAKAVQSDVSFHNAWRLA